MSEAIIVRAGNVTKSYVDMNLNLKVDKVEGKGLSTNDYDNTAKEAVDSLGTASKCNTGTSEGNVPIINSSGKLDTSIIPTDLVQSVNGKTGNVVLNHEDVGAVQSNTAITGATKCKITYDSKGLVTAGEDLTSQDIPDISETYETKSNKSDSFTASSSETYASTKALVDGLNTKAEFKKFTATIGTSWVQGENNEYTQEITLEGILEADTPTIDLVLSDNISTARSQIEAWSCVSRITTSLGKIKIYCYDSSPTTEIPIQIICVR